MTKLFTAALLAVAAGYLELEVGAEEEVSVSLSPTA